MRFAAQLPPMAEKKEPLLPVHARRGPGTALDLGATERKEAGVHGALEERVRGTVQRKARADAGYGDLVGGASRDSDRGALRVGAANDAAEVEADRVADAVMRGGGALGSGLSFGGVGVRRKCAACADEDERTVRREASGRGASTTAPPVVGEVLRSPGRPLESGARAFMETRFGHDFQDVRVHDDARAAESARAVSARAYTVGQNVVFGAGQYAPESAEGRRLVAHELAHVVQQRGVEHEHHHVQRTLGDGHDLASPRFARLLDLEAAYDREAVVKEGNSGRGVQAIQQALYDLGFPLPTSGADGQFGPETKAAVQAFQGANPPLAADGRVGSATMTVLDARFAAPVLPSVALRSAPWTSACVLSILCPWSPHTIDVLRTRITLKSFDDIFWTDEEWNGAAWVPSIFPGGGYNTGTEIGVRNSSCEGMAETLYHEVLHAEQPSRHTTTRQKESYAYRIGEEFSIAMGLSGRPGLRSTNAQGRQFADPAKVDTFVATEYPGVATGGEEIIGKGLGVGEVEVRRPDGSIYRRSAAVGEKVPGPITLVNEVTHDTSLWTC